MEKIIINSIEPKFGKPNTEGVCTPFWACQLSDGRKATIWDEGLGKTAMSNLNKELQVEIKVSQSGYPNIRSINIATQMPVEPLEGFHKDYPAHQDSVPQKVAQAPNPQRVGLYIKLAVEMAVANPMQDKTTEENLCENIQEIKKLEDFTVKLLS